ncbi:hypothetical protein EDD17DRAFT_1894397 [Pisolithus thermaeus]|nr:hypothetical protein EDD17DRAFT_1894397 [Pisolithus thermaeus]
MHLFNFLGGHWTLWCLVALGRGAVAGLVGSRIVEDDQTYAPPLIALLSVSIALFVMDSTSRLGSIRGPQNALAMSSMLRPPQTVPFDGEGSRKTVQLVPRVLSPSGDYHPSAETNNTDEDTDDIDQSSPRSSIRLINRPPGDLPHTLYGPLGISQLSPILGTTDSVSLWKTPFEFSCKPLSRPPLPPKHWTSDVLTPGQPYDLASVSACLPGSQFLPLTTLNSAVRSVTLEREHATCELASEKWNTRPRSRKARFRSHPVGASPLRASLIPDDTESMSSQAIRTNDENVPSIIAAFGETFGYAVLPPLASCTPRTPCIANDQSDPTAGVEVQAMTLLPDNTSVITTDPSRNGAFIRTRVPDGLEDDIADAGPDRFCFDSKNFYEENGEWPTRTFPRLLELLEGDFFVKRGPLFHARTVV